MGHILMPSEAFIRSLSEDAGCRSGFALGEADILECLGSDHRFVEEITAREAVRLASDDYADAVGDMLFALGAARTPGMPPLSRRFLWNIGQEPGEDLDLFQLMKVEAVGREFARRKLARDDRQAEVLKELRLLLGVNEAAWFPGLLAAIDEEIGVNPFYVRQIKKSNMILLRDLFKSEILPSDDGRFFDQRFVDYLN